MLKKIQGSTSVTPTAVLLAAGQYNHHLSGRGVVSRHTWHLLERLTWISGLKGLSVQNKKLSLYSQPAPVYTDAAAWCVTHCIILGIESAKGALTILIGLFDKESLLLTAFRGF